MRNISVLQTTASEEANQGWPYYKKVRYFWNKRENIDLEHGNYKEFTCGSKSRRFGFKMSLHPLHFFLILMLFFLSFHPLSIDNSKLLQLSLSS